ncbi:MAG: aspartate racemase [Rhodobacteraceae bacterium]|nr:aspartate racemase [Paracoccaceae bacterium]
MSLKPIGILGGMGPAATILLQKKLMEALPQAVDDTDHIPLLIDMNPQVPSRIAHLIKETGEDPTPVLTKMAKRLEESGAVALAMPCNTAHHYASAIKNAVSIPFLDMISLTARKVSQSTKDYQTIGILASPAVRKTRLFENALGRLNRTTVWPKDDGAILSAIQLIKKQGVGEQSYSIIESASRDLAQRGASTQIVACSEFSLITEQLSSPGASLVDSLDLLVNAIIGFSTP